MVLGIPPFQVSGVFNPFDGLRFGGGGNKLVKDSWQIARTMHGLGALVCPRCDGETNILANPKRRAVRLAVATLLLAQMEYGSLGICAGSPERDSRQRDNGD